jgi:DNA-binding transcriptional MerR regulator
MARVAKASKSTKSITPPREPGRSLTVTGTKPAKTGKPTLSTRSRAAAPIEKRKPGRPAKGSIVAPTISTRATKTALRAPARPLAPKASKEELRVQVEKMEQLITTLRAKSREANKAAKEATARISELEQQVAQLEKKIASASAPARQPGPPKPARAKRQGHEIDPGDTVSPSVAVQDPAPLDEEAETTLEKLEEHLGQG